jgi:hypothetical protein
VVTQLAIQRRRIDALHVRDSGTLRLWKVPPSPRVRIFGATRPNHNRTWASIRMAMQDGRILSCWDQLEACCGSFFLSVVAMFYFACIVSGAIVLSLIFGSIEATVAIGLLAAVLGARVPYEILKETWPK